jgi:GMP synthase (glutamine-hydrolysing)
VQYHPEFDLSHLAALYEGYGDDMVGTPFFDTRAALDQHISELREIDREGQSGPAAWRLGVDEDLLDGTRRRTELRNWLMTQSR